MKRLALAVIVLAACGGDSGGLDSLGSRLGKVSCQKMFQCCSQAEIMQQFMDFKVNGQPITTESQCEQFFGGLFGAFATQAYKDSLAKHRIEYDGAAADACIAQLQAATCAEYNGTQDGNAQCPPFIIPQVADG